MPKLLKSFEFQVERGKIAEFAKATGAGDIACFFDEEAAQNSGFPKIPAQLTFGTVPEMWNGIGTILLDALQLDQDTVLLHGSHSFKYVQPIYAGDRLTGETSLTAVNQKKNLTFYTMNTLIRHETGNPALESEWVVIVRGSNDEQP